MNDVGSSPRLARARAFLRWPRWLAALGGVLLLALLARACGRSDQTEYLTQAAHRGPLVVTVTATGTLQPTDQVDVGSELSGTMRSVRVDFNDPVRKGQVLARLDTTRLDAQVLQSQAAVSAAKAQIEQAEASRLEAEAQLARFQRVHEMSGGKVPSASELDTARANAARANAQLSSARAAAEQASATLSAQRTDLGKAAILSPIDGVVLKRSVEPGQTVAASFQAPVLFTIAEDLTHMELLVAVDEADVSGVADGQHATFSVDAWPDRTFDAQVIQVRYGADKNAGVVSYGALLLVDNPEHLLRPGMTATADIVVKRVADALLVPDAALRFVPPVRDAKQSSGFMRMLMPGPPRVAPPSARTAGGPRTARTVYRVRAGKLERVEIEVGDSDGTSSEVRRGALAPGDELAVDLKSAAQ